MERLLDQTLVGLILIGPMMNINNACLFFGCRRLLPFWHLCFSLFTHNFPRRKEEIQTNKRSEGPFSVDRSTTLVREDQRKKSKQGKGLEDTSFIKEQIKDDLFYFSFFFASPLFWQFFFFPPLSFFSFFFFFGFKT